MPSAEACQVRPKVRSTLKQKARTNPLPTSNSRNDHDCRHDQTPRSALRGGFDRFEFKSVRGGWRVLLLRRLCPLQGIID